MANPIDFFRGDAAVRSRLYGPTIGYDAYLDEAITIPNPWGRKEVNIKKMSEETITVAVRIRPLSQKEVEKGEASY